ncbi:MAG: CHASE2 domain-containing protein, partial [Burkholderiales bacterium]
WVQLFDWLTLDTKIESYTMWLGGLFTQPAPSSDIALVAINEATFRRLNKPLEKMSLDPTWRREHARLIETLSRAGARTVAFDVFLKESSSYDEELIAAIVAAKSRNTAVVFVTRGEPLPIAGLENAAFGLACIGARIGYAPVAPLAVQEKPGLAAFALMAAHPGGKIKRIDRKNREITLLTADEELKTIRYSDDELMSSSQRSCPVLEGAKVALLFIDFSPLESWRDTARRFRYEEVVAAAVANGTEQFKGKVVLVGHETERDTLSFFQGFRREERYGFEVHADALSTVLRGVHIRPLDPVGQWLIMLGMGALGAAAQVLPQLNTPIKRRIYRFGAVAAYLVLTVLLYVKYQFLLNTLYHIAAFFFADWTTGKAKRRLGLSESG